MNKGHYDVSGTYVSEFIDNVNDIIAIKEVPLSEQKIKNMIPFRNPLITHQFVLDVNPFLN